jgi:predicted phage tail protein
MSAGAAGSSGQGAAGGADAESRLRQKTVRTAATGESDFQNALAELDREFPGAAHDESLAPLAAKRKTARARRAALKSFLITRGIFFAAGAGFLIAAAGFFPPLAGVAAALAFYGVFQK